MFKPFNKLGSKPRFNYRASLLVDNIFNYFKPVWSLHDLVSYDLRASMDRLSIGVAVTLSLAALIGQALLIVPLLGSGKLAPSVEFYFNLLTNNPYTRWLLACQVFFDSLTSGEAVALAALNPLDDDSNPNKEELKLGEPSQGPQRIPPESSSGIVTFLNNIITPLVYGPSFNYGNIGTIAVQSYVSEIDTFWNDSTIQIWRRGQINTKMILLQCLIMSMSSVFSTLSTWSVAELAEKISDGFDDYGDETPIETLLEAFGHEIKFVGWDPYINALIELEFDSVLKVFMTMLISGNEVCIADLVAYLAGEGLPDDYTGPFIVTFDDLVHVSETEGNLTKLEESFCSPFLKIVRTRPVDS